MLKQRLQQKLLQKLSPQQIQMIKLLEIPAMQLEQRIKKEIEENPALEEGEEQEQAAESEQQEEETFEDSEQDEFSLDDYLGEEDIQDYKLQIQNYSKDEGQKSEIPFSTGLSFHEMLESQIGLRILTEKQQLLSEYILGNIDEDGYLRRELENIVDDLAFSQNIIVKEEELLEVLEIVQDLEPPGIGARNLRECLLLQIARKDMNDPIVNRAYIILDKFFDEFTRKHYDKIQARLDIEDDDLREALDEILKLNPKPGGSFSDPLNRGNQHIIPDFNIDLRDNDIEVSLNSRNLPELRVSRTYSEMLETYAAGKEKTRSQKDAVAFVKQKLDSARWFIDAMKQRQNTLLLTMNAILEYQREYFLEGDETKLKPMILKDIAEITDLDISTISRVANSKYIQTHFGIFPLKYFFSEGMQTDSGEEVSTREIKTILQDCLSAEDKRKPLTDEKLTEILQEKGYQIARRTVAKYREQLNIPVARLRKEI
ncbi:MAG: RNA polymerase factor sigma-54 [Bacteroidia bacterium]|nr:MAG: RNA polymerase factor sigma-54 [Bacteroidia bacterium]